MKDIEKDKVKKFIREGERAKNIVNELARERGHDIVKLVEELKFNPFSLTISTHGQVSEDPLAVLQCNIELGDDSIPHRVETNVQFRAGEHSYPPDMIHLLNDDYKEKAKDVIISTLKSILPHVKSHANRLNTLKTEISAMISELEG